MLKKFTFLILTLAVLTVISGCGKEEVVINGNENQDTDSGEVIPREEIKYLENGEIDTSDWLTFRSDILRLEIQYPEFLLNHQNSESGFFGFYSPKDKNWDLQFGKTLPDFVDLPLEEKKQEFRDLEIRNDTFEESATNNGKGYIFYEVRKTFDGYRPGALILGERKIISCSIQIFDENTDFQEYDPKYIKVFKEVIKTIKFD